MKISIFQYLAVVCTRLVIKVFIFLSHRVASFGFGAGKLFDFS